MAIRSITNTSAAYQDTPQVVQKANTDSRYMTNSSSNPVGFETGTDVTMKTLIEKQEKTDDSNQQKKEAELNAQRLKSAVDQANNKMKHVRTGCEFSYHEATNRVSITVYDKDTKEVIKEIPPEESLEMLEKIWEIAGLLVDERR